MPSIHDIANKADNAGKIQRRGYLKNLYKYTGRNVICYYSNFLANEPLENVDINDSDMHGFMSTVYKLDKNKGLDLIIQTPGGDPTALEAIVNYLYSIFGKENIRAFVPHMAMSAGTMLACACNTIYMGKHSSLGPIDPQFGGIPAFDIIQEFDKAKREMSEDESTMAYWQTLLMKYPVAFYEKCKKSTELSEELLKQWLEENMFRGENAEYAIKNILDKLNENAKSKTHSRHFDIKQCQDMGLKIFELESNPKLQEYILTLHHCYMHLFNEDVYISKIIENHNSMSVTTRGSYSD